MGKRIRKKRRVVSVADKLMAKLERLQRLVVIKRDGGVCLLKNSVPIINGCSNVLQADHFVTKKRGNMFTKFDLRNLNLVCSGHNMTKQWDNECSHELAKIIDIKHGPGTVDELYRIVREQKGYKPPLEFFEEKIKYCEDFLSDDIF